MGATEPEGFEPVELRTLELRGELEPEVQSVNYRLFRTIFDHSALGIALVGPAGRPERCNPALERLLGYSEAELRRMPFTEFTHPDDRDLDWQLYLELAEGRRTSYQIDKRYITKDGAVVWARLTASRVPSPPGTPVLGIGMVEDVSASKASEAERERLVWVLGERVKELTAIRKTARLLQTEGWTLETLVREVAALLPLAVCYPEAAAARVRYGGISAQTAGFDDRGAKLTQDFTTTDGLPGVLEVGYFEARPEADDGPFLADERAMLAAISDMLRVALDRNIANEALRQSEERLKLAIWASGLGVWEYDVTADRITWSDELAAMLELDPAHAPRTLSDFVALVHPGDRAAIQTAMSRVLDSAGRVGLESDLRLRRSSGEYGWFHSKARLVDRAQGHKLLLGTTSDITEQRRLEERLRQVQKMEAIGRVAAEVSHDFNNLLSIVTANAWSLVDELPADHPHCQLAREIAQAAERGTQLTRQLLTFGRKSEVNLQLLDLNQRVLEAESLIRRLAGKLVMVDVRLEHEPCPIRADAGQIEQLLVNLIVNARDAMPEGGRLRIETRAVELDEATPVVQGGEARSGPHVMLAVEDTGHGMKPETLAQIFEPFFTTKEPGKGTGLGLSVVFGIVRQSEGHVTVESVPGVGTTFRVFLPRSPGVSIRS